MSDKGKYIFTTLLDFALTWGGTAGVIVANFISKETATGYKLTFGGIVLVVALLFTAKAMFEKSYREKYDVYLQQLAEATDADVKKVISAQINIHKMKNDIYQRLMLLLPFAVLYVVTWLGATALENLQGTVGLILASMGAGSIFNIAKKPLGDKVRLAKSKDKAFKNRR